MWHSSLRYVSFKRLPFGRRSTSGGVNFNKGLLTDRERGDPFTEPHAYRNKKSIAAISKVAKKQDILLREEKQRKELDKIQSGYVTERELHIGCDKPLGGNANEIARVIDEQALISPTPGEKCSTALRELMENEVDRRNHMMDKFGQPVGAREFHRLFKELRHADNEAETIERHQTRLVEEYGVYPSLRLDAYMLDDDTYFPEWVNALPYSIRDRVKFGSLGLTEKDEALRVTLGRMPLDRRRREWERLKKAKEYKAAKEETLTLAELRDARQGKRRFHWLQRKRQKRASILRRLALRKPDAFELWPSRVVDYSQRIAFIAQHVENGLDTKGQWPLDPEELARARVRRSKEEAERTFLMSAEEKRAHKKLSGRSGDGSISEMLQSLEVPDKPFKRLSRKVYANRVNAIVHGDQDEYGRRYRKMETRSKRRMRPYASLGEIGLENELRKEPRINAKGLNNTDDEDWPRHTKSWGDGMPSMRYGS
uniref:mt-LAF21 n=1 Tax=Trypanosoma brucei brucei TaxID=5702 RepID=UPI00178D07D7|nr:Chain E1, mt-LAF21 [Trypanosoma brucei brucei]